MNYKSILFFLGIYSFAVAFLSILNILYAIYFNFILDLNSYLVTLILSFLVGSFFCFIGRKQNKNISSIYQILLIILTLLFIPVLISIPYYLSVYDFNFLNSYFESVSGFTTTGFSMIENPKLIDEPLLLWRSTSQWLGGLFFLIATLGTLGSKKIKIKPVYLLTEENLSSNFYVNFNENFIRILLIYFISTILIIFFYNLTNIRLFDSFNLALTVISSGGFIRTNSLSEITSDNLQILVLAITLLIPIFNFYLLFKILTKKFKFHDHQEDLYLGILVFSITLIFYFFILSDESFSSVFLSVASSISTSGISTHSSDLDVSLFFILLTIIGGSLISVSSGFKYIGFYILLKISYQEIYRLVKPINIFNRNLFNSDVQVNDEDLKIVFLVFISFIVAMFVLSGLLTLDNLSFENSFKLSILTLTNTVTSSLYGMSDINFLNLNYLSKIALMIFMIFAKIEIIAVLFLIKKFIFKG